MVGGSPAATPMEATPTFSAPHGGGHLTQQLNNQSLEPLRLPHPSNNFAQKSYAEASGPKGKHSQEAPKAPFLPTQHPTPIAALAQASGSTIGTEANPNPQHTTCLTPS